MCATRASATASVKKDFWLDFEDLPGDCIGYFVRSDQSHPFINHDVHRVADSLAAFIEAAGLRAQEARGKQVGSTTGALLVAILPKLIGPTIAMAKLASRWMTEQAAQRRREQLPLVSITLLADHMDPVRLSDSCAYDSARTLCLLLPELLAHLKEAFPARQFHLKIRARAAKVERVEIRTGGALPLTESNVRRILKLLDQDVPQLTIMHTRGWFRLPTVASARWVAPHDLSRLGRIWGLGRTWGTDPSA